MDYITPLLTIAGVLALSVMSPGPNVALITAIAASVSAVWYCGLACVLSVPALRRALLRAKAAIDVAAGVFLIVIGGRVLAGR